MLKGDLRSTPLAPLLLQLANDAATGCLQILDSEGDEALVYYKSGLVYAVVVPGTRPQLGAKLVSSGAIAPEALADALQAQRTELQGWRLGELLVHLGYVEQPVVEAFIREQVRDALWDLLLWPGETWKFRKNVKAREDVGPPLAVVDLLETLRERGYEWESISAILHGPNAVPSLSTRGHSDPETILDNDAWSMLCKIDGERSVGELARDCGYTMFEAGQVIVALVQSGLVDIDDDVDLAGSAPYGASTLTSAFAGGLIDVDGTSVDEDDADRPDDAMSRLARLVSEVAGEGLNGDGGPSHDGVGSTGDQPPARSAHYDGSMTMRIPSGSEESFAASIARVSSALSDVLGSEAPADDPAVGVRAPRPRRVDIDDPEWERRQRLRAAAAAELATAQAMIESLREGHDPAEPAAALTDEVPKVVDPEVERERVAARETEEAQRRAAEEATRLAAEQFARAAAEEADRVAAEQAAQLAAEQTGRRAAEAAERLAAERTELETQAWAEYGDREEAERQATAEEAERQAVAEEAERLAAAEAARLAAEAAAAAAEETERLAAEEAARLAAEAEAADEAARLAAQAEAEAAAAAEAERLAAEEAERLAAAAAAAAEAEAAAAADAEAERIAAEEAARQAEAAQAEQAERAAAEEAARQAADVARQAEQAEAAAAADAEAERVAAEKAAVRAAAKAERAAQRKAQKLAADEAARHADHAAATALLVELAMEVEPTPSPPAAQEADITEAPDPADTPQPTDSTDEAAADAGNGTGADDGDGDGHAEETAEQNGSGHLRSDAETTDTAALLRELSSLGVEEDRRPADPTPPRTPRPTSAPEKKPKKKIGLFGR